MYMYWKEASRNLHFSLSLSLSLSIQTPFENPEMCYLLYLVDRFSCQHRILGNRQKIDCQRRYCILSDSHIRTPHPCLHECFQMMAETQELVTDYPDRQCRHCLVPDT